MGGLCRLQLLLLWQLPRQLRLQLTRRTTEYDTGTRGEMAYAAGLSPASSE